MNNTNESNCKTGKIELDIIEWDKPYLPMVFGIKWGNDLRIFWRENECTPKRKLTERLSD